MRTATSSHSSGITRRQMLRRLGAFGLTSAAALLAACQPSPPPAPTAPPTAVPTQAPPQAAPAKAAEAPKPAAPTTQAAAKAEPTRGGKLVYGITREVDSMDPTKFGGSTAMMVMFGLYETLVNIRAEDNTLQPGLAESWTISPDGKTYTFKLKRGVKFHDGTPFTSQAVKYTMDRVHDPNAKTRLVAGAYGFYEATDTPDDYTAVIRLSRPWAPLLDSLSLYYRIISPTAGQKYGEELTQNPVGSGPFMFKEFVPNSHVTLVRFPDYNWAPPMFKNRGPAYLDEVTFRLIPEASTRVAALERGEAQGIDTLPAQDLERMKADPKYSVLVGLVPGQSYTYGMNMRKPPTNEIAVRQAMNYAVSQEAVVKTVFGPYQSLGANSPAHNVLTPITWGYEKQAAEVYKYDPAKARELLEGAGWKVGSDGIRQKDGQRLEIQLATWENGVVEVVQAQVREVGIDLKIQVAPVVATNEAARREQVHMSPLPSTRRDPDVLAQFHTRNRAGNEFTFHSNDRLNQLLDDGPAATNDEERRKIYSEIQMIMMQDAMFLPVFNRDTVVGLRSEVKDLTLDRGFYPFLQDVHIAR